MKKQILLVTISNIFDDWIPYAVGCLISHCNKNQKIQDSYVFMEPEYKNKWDTPEFHEKLKKADILGLTCYVWNQTANDKISKIYKEYNPNGIVIYGGPNVPEENLKDFKRPYVDHYITGPGELKFEKLLDPSADSEYVLPTPYTDGVFDNIFKTQNDIAVPLETNRGCPYHCAFCDWGGVARSKITKLTDEQVYSQIEYILKHKNVKMLDILDANYGIFPRDVDFIKHIVKNKKRKDMLLTFSGFAKNGSKYLSQIIKLVMENFEQSRRSIKISLQTFTPEVLKVIDRDNIKTDNLLKIINDLHDVDINSELIIGLPGETAESFADTLFKSKDYNIDSARVYPLYVLPNTPMAQKDYKEKYKIKTKTIKLPNGEQFEMVYECFSFDIDELVKMYLYWWYYNTFYNFGIDKSITKETMIHFFENLKNMPFIQSCVDEVKNGLYEIFDPNNKNVLSDYSFKLLHKQLGRGNELVYIKNNIDLANKELGLNFKIYNSTNQLTSPFVKIKEHP